MPCQVAAIPMLKAVEFAFVQISFAASPTKNYMMHLLVVQHCGFIPDADPPQRESSPQREDDESPDLENLVCVPLQFLEFAVIPNLQHLQLALPRANDNPCVDLRMKLPNTGNPCLANTTGMCTLTTIAIDCGVNFAAKLPRGPEAQSDACS